MSQPNMSMHGLQPPPLLNYPLSKKTGGHPKTYRTLPQQTLTMGIVPAKCSVPAVNPVSKELAVESIYHLDKSPQRCKPAEPPASLESQEAPRFTARTALRNRALWHIEREAELCQSASALRPISAPLLSAPRPDTPHEHNKPGSAGVQLANALDHASGLSSTIKEQTAVVEALAAAAAIIGAGPFFANLRNLVAFFLGGSELPSPDCTPLQSGGAGNVSAHRACL
eukprot:gene21760-26174_t